jgi:CSLREA domain-containing protein
MNRHFRTIVALAALAMVAALFVTTSGPSRASTTFVVNIPGDAQDANNGDGRCDVNPAGTGDQCSLRAAIEQANSTPGADAINFNIPDDFGTGVHTINVGTNDRGQLPAITEQVTINGYTQPGASPNTLAVGDDAKLMIELNGTNVGGAFDSNGLILNTSNSTIRGLVINRFGFDNILIDGDGNKVQGNFIGTDPTGTLSGLGNTADGVEVVSGFNNTIGGAAKDARNVISGNQQGIIISNGSNNSIQGNYIGTDKSGQQNLGNASSGVSILSSNNTVGGTTTGAGNVISGSRSDGVFISSASGTRVLGNRIGTTASGTGELGNIGDGVGISNSSDSFVGDGTAAGSNTIAFNTSTGVGVSGAGSTDNRILSNSIFSNVDLGVDLGNNGPTANDGNDPNTPLVDPDGDAGPNRLQNFPVLSSAKTGSDGTVIQASLNSLPSTAFTVEFFANPGGTNEGNKLIGKKLITTDALGNASFTFSPTVQVAAGQAITATAMNGSTGDTSEFSAPRLVTDGKAPTVVSVSPAQNATGVSPSANVSAVFSEAMTPSTINASTVTLKRAGATTKVGATVTYSTAGKKATLNPNANLKRGATYVATVTSGAKDVAGNALDQSPGLAGNQPKSWKFTVRR